MRLVQQVCQPSTVEAQTEIAFKHFEEKDPNMFVLEELTTKPAHNSPGSIALS
jgi:hypothetical protein